MSNFRWLTINEENKEVLLKKFNGFEIEESEYNKDDVIHMAILDTETTGLDYKEDKIIELAFITFLYDTKNNKVVKIIDKYNELNDPKEELSEKITKLTGITNEDLKDKYINWDLVKQKLFNVEVCICHNSRFDRSFFQKYTDVLKDIPWLCSYSQIPWNEEYNFPVQKQEILTLYHGFYYEGHRALTDCEALLKLLLINTPKKEITYLDYLLKTKDQSEYLIIAKNTDFKQKSYFNNNEYYWEPYLKLWFKSIVNKEEAQEDFIELSETIYSNRRLEAEVVEILPHQKFKPIELLLKEVNLKTNFKNNKKLVLIARKSPYKVIIKKDGVEKEVESRFLFKLKGYEWFKDQKVWYIYLNEDEVENEKEWLRSYIYGQDFIGEVKKNKYYKKVK